MAQHFLLSAKARTLCLAQISTMSESKCCEYFRHIRWQSNNGKPVCDECGSVKCYTIKSRKQYRCKECFHTFSVTSGTIFHARNVLQKHTASHYAFHKCHKGHFSFATCKDLGVQYKSAWVLAHKLRESLLDYDDSGKLYGVVEMDGVNGYIRPKNHKDERVDRRKIYKPNKRVVISLRQRNALGLGAIHTKSFILKSENNKDINNIAFNNISPNTQIRTDENVAYDDLAFVYDLKRVNHQCEFSGENSENNNQSESFNARLRHMIYGQVHRMNVLYLSNYANEIAYREDTRRLDNKAIYDDILVRCLKNNSISNEFCGYWQGNKRLCERLGC